MGRKKLPKQGNTLDKYFFPSPRKIDILKLNSPIPSSNTSDFIPANPVTFSNIDDSTSIDSVPSHNDHSGDLLNLIRTDLADDDVSGAVNEVHEMVILSEQGIIPLTSTTPSSSTSALRMSRNNSNSSDMQVLEQETDHFLMPLPERSDRLRDGYNARFSYCPNPLMNLNSGETRTNVTPDFRSGLNAEQIEAATSCPNTPLCIQAGAGTGKTRTLIARLAFLVESGVDPREILAITFTQKAAHELRERLSGYPEWQGLVTICTFHALSLQAIRRHYKEAGFKDRPLVVAGKEQLDYLRTAVIEHAHLQLALDAHNVLRSAERPAAPAAGGASSAPERDPTGPGRADYPKVGAAEGEAAAAAVDGEVRGDSRRDRAPDAREAADAPLPPLPPGGAASPAQPEAFADEGAMWKFLSDTARARWPGEWDRLAGRCRAKAKKRRRGRSKGALDDSRGAGRAGRKAAKPAKGSKWAQGAGVAGGRRSEEGAGADKADGAADGGDEEDGGAAGGVAAAGGSFRMDLCSLIVGKLMPAAVAEAARERWATGLSAREVTRRAKEAQKRISAQKCIGERPGVFVAGTEEREVWVRYQAALRRAGALDFDDMLTVFRDLMTDERRAAVQRRVRAAYTHVLVDEFQDNNRVGGAAPRAAPPPESHGSSPNRLRRAGELASVLVMIRRQGYGPAQPSRLCVASGGGLSPRFDSHRLPSCLHPSPLPHPPFRVGALPRAC